MLRSVLRARLQSITDKFLKGEMHKANGRIDDDIFFESVSPIVLEVTGDPEDCSDEELPGKCMTMARDILRKKKTYQEKKKKAKEGN